MAATQYYYGKPKGSSGNDVSNVWSKNIEGLAAGSVSGAYDDGGWFSPGEEFGGQGQPDLGVQASNTWNDEVGGFSGLASGIGSVVDTIGGLADMWFKYDALKSQKASARDTHNANVGIYNNTLTRATDTQASISGSGNTTDRRQNLKKSTV